MSKEYNTEQKRRILSFLRTNSDRHFTVDEIAEQICDESIGKSTVYRYITKLFDSGLIRRFESSKSRSFVYQYAHSHENCDEHFHLKCIECGRLIHMECDSLNEVREHIKDAHDFIIGCDKAVLYGKCKDCAVKDA